MRSLKHAFGVASGARRGQPLSHFLASAPKLTLATDPDEILFFFLSCSTTVVLGCCSALQGFLNGPIAEVKSDPTASFKEFDVPRELSAVTRAPIGG